MPSINTDMLEATLYDIANSYLYILIFQPITFCFRLVSPEVSDGDVDDGNNSSIEWDQTSSGAEDDN